MTLREFDAYIQRAPARQLLSMHYCCLIAHNKASRGGADSPEFQFLRQKMGKQPNRLSMLRASLMLFQKWA